MGVHYNQRYTSVSQIKGPSGWYNIDMGGKTITVYVDQEYDGGGWTCVLANRGATGGMKNLSYYDAVNSCNYRTGTSDATNAAVTGFPRKMGSLADYNIWVGVDYWKRLASQQTSGKITVVQFVSGTNGTGLASTGSHNKRYRWRFTGFNATYGMVGAEALSDETGTGAPGFYGYHAANGYSLTTYDKDQDSYGTNCSNLYNNNPWWYGSCWSGNYFAGGSGYTDYPYWNSSGGDYFQYGAVYIK